MVLGFVAVAGVAAIAVAAWPEERTQPQVVLPSEPASARGPAVSREPAPESDPVPETPSEPAPGGGPDAVPETQPTPEPGRRSHRRARAAPAATPTEHGRVNVVTPGGWADVYIGERLLGRTPRSVQLPPGDHVLELRPFGRSPGRHVRVHLEAGGVERVVSQVTQ